MDGHGRRSRNHQSRRCVRKHQLPSREQRFQLFQYKAVDGSTLTSAMKSASQYNPTAVALSTSARRCGTGSSRPTRRPASRSSRSPSVTPSDIVTPGSSSQIDYAKAGELLANWFISDSKSTGKALVMDVPAFAVLKAYGDGFKAAAKKACGVSALDIAPAQLATNGVGPAIASDLQKDPSLKIPDRHGRCVHRLPTGGPQGGRDQRCQRARHLRACHRREGTAAGYRRAVARPHVQRGGPGRRCRRCLWLSARHRGAQAAASDPRQRSLARRCSLEDFPTLQPVAGC